MPPLTDKAASFARTETEEGTMGEVPEMVERVARALCAEDGVNPDGHCDQHHPDGPQLAWTVYIPPARAAIAAMREPTSWMVEAAWEDVMHEDAGDVWRQMVDASLESPLSDAALGNPQVAE